MRFLLILVISVTYCYGDTLPEVESKSGQRFLPINFYLYNRKNHREPIPLREGLSEIDFGKEFAIIVHGYRGHHVGGIETFNKVLKDAFLTNDGDDDNFDMNVIIMDWSLYITMFNYETAVSQASEFAYSLTRFVDELLTEEIQDNNNKIPTTQNPSTDSDLLNNLHLVGFDVGAHIVGIAGRRLEGKVARITGLDPAASGWGPNSLRLRSTDAKYVEVIHTDSSGTGALGLADQIGNNDFYANGGTRQTGCTTNLCSHDRAWELFAATLTHPRLLRSNRCLSLAQMNSNACTLFSPASIGTNELQKPALGIIRVNTGRIYPYEV